MASISKRTMMIIGVIAVLIIAVCGYSIICRNMSGEVTIKQENKGENYVESNDARDNNLSDEAKGKSPKEIVVHIIGSVKKPGLTKIAEGGRISDAIEAAGGTLKDADLESINLACKLQDGKQVYIPSKNDSLEPSTLSSKNKTATLSKSSAQSSVPTAGKLKPGIQEDKEPPKKAASDYSGIVEENNTGVKQDIININTASAEELDKLPGIGPSTAQKIIEYRKTKGGFKVPEDVMKVKGIGKAKYEKIKDKIGV